LTDALRTPDRNFAGLPDWPYAQHYFERPDGLRLHYVDEGPREANRTWLCLHGQPTWSYLYRRMIPVFVGAGDRVVAPDFLGFGRSDKPVDETLYTFDFHRETLLGLIEALDLRNVTLVVQDWGGLIGLTLPMAASERYAALLVMNTALGTGDAHLGEAEAAAYAAPFPDATYKAAVRRFPNLVPDRPDAGGAALSRQARAFWRERWTGKSLMAIGMKDPVLGPPVMRALHAEIRNCPPPLEIADGGHFLQEWGKEVAEAATRAL
jgi:haloalkane dehalogenase